MALEQRVYEELTEIEPKVLFGLTARQLVAVALTAVSGGCVIVLMWLAGHRSGFTSAVIPVAAPLIAWGWFKPKGLRFDAWLAHSWKFWSAPTRRYYANSPVWEHEREGQRYVVGKQVKGWTEAGR